MTDLKSPYTKHWVGQTITYCPKDDEVMNTDPADNVTIDGVVMAFYRCLRGHWWAKNTRAQIWREGVEPLREGAQ